MIGVRGHIIRPGLREVLLTSSVDIKRLLVRNLDELSSLLEETFQAHFVADILPEKKSPKQNA